MRFVLLRVLYGALAGLCLGLLAGSGELLYRTYTEMKLLMTPAQWSALYGMALLLYGGLGAAVGGGTALALSPLAGRGVRARYYRDVMKRDLLAPTLAPVLGVLIAVLGGVVASPWVLAALRDPAGRTWGVAVLGLLFAIAGMWGLASYRLLRRRDEGDAPPLPLWLPVPVLVLALFIAGVVKSPAGGKGYGSHVNAALPNLVLITVDTFRADHLSWLGHPRASTPTLDYFARKHVYFPNAVTPIGETAPSHASMLTGLHPLDHGVLDNASPLPDGAYTLAEYLGDQGYTTGAFVSAYSLDRDLALDQGFAVYDDDFAGRVRGLDELSLRRLTTWIGFRFGKPATMDNLERPAARTTARADEWLRRHVNENFFLWVHYFEPHAPYVPHGLPGFEANGTPGAPTLDHVALLDERGNDYSEAEAEQLRALYAEECSYLDREIGELLRKLEEYRALERSVVIVIGDHGESLGEHGIAFSHMGLYDPVLRVPFMLRAPSLGDERAVVDDQVRVQDVFPTALRLMGFRYAAAMDGRDLVPRIRGEEQGDLQALLVGRMGKLGSGLWTGMRERPWKYLRSPPPEAAEEYYWLEQDPGELDDVAATETQAVEAARVGVNAALGGTSVQSDSAGHVAPDQAERLRALGYVE